MTDSEPISTPWPLCREAGSLDLNASRISQAGLERAFLRARTLFPDRTILTLVDRATDMDGVPLCQHLRLSCRLATGNPDKDLQGVSPSNCVWILGFDSDEKVDRYIRHIQHSGGKYICSLDIQNARWWHLRDEAREVLRLEEADCRTHGYSHFAPDQLANIMQAIDITRPLRGAYVEIGVYKGTSARLAYHYMCRTSLERRCYFLDTYQGFHYDSAKASSDIYWQGTHESTAEEVEARLEATPRQRGPQPVCRLIRHNVVTDPWPEEIGPIAVCNVDVDLSDAIRASLEHVWPRIEPGGICIVQDPGRTPMLGGARSALNTFLEAGLSSGFPVYLESGQTFLLKR